MRSAAFLTLSTKSWAFIAGVLPLLYVIVYAPYGINDADGGFLTGLAWHLQCGGQLYRDVLYVRPPLPVWGRWLELQLLPVEWAVLGERCLFYGKVWLYSLIGAGLLTTGRDRWVLTALGFVVSAHCYPPAAWHTIDGILLATAGFAALQRRWLLVGSALVGGALLCKQSFYPLVVLWLAALPIIPFLLSRWRPRTDTPLILGRAVSHTALSVLGFALPFMLTNWFVDASAMLPLINGSTQGGQAWRFGIAAYFSINPVVASSAIGLLPVGWYYGRGQGIAAARLGWAGFLCWLLITYGYSIWQQQDFTLPFAQTKLLFWVAAGYWIWRSRTDYRVLTGGAAAMGIAWTASVSWGYALPVMFSTPWVWAAWAISRDLWPDASGRRNLAALLVLLGIFRCAYEFVYQDGQRSDMTAHLGDVFPKLQGIYSTPATAAKYAELRELAHRYPRFKTLPTFNAAHYLTNGCPALPLDWIARREYNGDEAPLWQADAQNRPFYFMEKRFSPDRIGSDPELAFTKQIMETRQCIEKGTFFDVYAPQ